MGKPNQLLVNIQKNFFTEGELDEKAVVRLYRTTASDGRNKKALYLQANNRAFKTFLDG